jgi:hypothetical protein
MASPQEIHFLQSIPPSRETVAKAFFKQAEIDYRVSKVVGVILSLASAIYLCSLKVFHLTNISYPLIGLIAGVALILLASQRLKQLHRPPMTQEAILDYCEKFKEYVNGNEEEKLSHFFSTLNPWNRDSVMSTHIPMTIDHDTQCTWGRIKVFKEMIKRTRENITARVPDRAEEMNTRLNTMEILLQQLEKTFPQMIENFFNNVYGDCDEEVSNLVSSWKRDIPLNLRFLPSKP